MGNELAGIDIHMRALGMGALTYANWHANYYSPDNPMWNELSVMQAAHAAEILIKARIAAEHPLLIFEQLPKSSDDNESPLSLEQLVEDGRTFQYKDLPNRLWATTGIKLPNPQVYQSFGRLRNAIQHFTVPDRDVAQETLEFIYGVIDPFIHRCWGLCAVDYNEDHEPYIYLVEDLVRHGVLFLVSPGVVKDLAHVTLDWPKDNPQYKEEMERRFGAVENSRAED